MRVLAIDPGTTQSAWCLLDDDGMPDAFGIAQNDAVLHELVSCFTCEPADVLAIEMVASYGMAVGEDVFRTVWWTGRFAQAWFEAQRSMPIEVYRKEEKMFLCGNNTAKDSNIRQALIDRYGGEGGKEAAIGRKGKEGPLYGFSKDAWAALAVAVTAQARFKQQARAA